MKNTIAIVGANSHIARNLIRYIDDGLEMTTMKLYDKDEAHKDGLASYRMINFFQKDDYDNIDYKSDIIFFFVGKTGTTEGFDNIDAFLDINERTLLYFLNGYRKNQSEAKVIFPSTRLLYSNNMCADEAAVSNELKTVYAVNKYACEKYLEMYHTVFGVKYCIFRICIPYGTMINTSSSYGTIEMMMDRAKNGKNITLYGDGSVKRTFTYMQDLCDVLFRGAMNIDCVNDTYNIGGETFSLNDIAKKIAKKFDVAVEYIPYPNIAKKIESGDTVFDDSRIRKALGDYIYKTSFESWIDSL